MTLTEEYDDLAYKIYKLDQNLPWDLHPNQLNAQTIYRNRLTKKINAIAHSTEGKDHRLLPLL